MFLAYILALPWRNVNTLYFGISALMNVMSVCVGDVVGNRRNGMLKVFVALDEDEEDMQTLQPVSAEIWGFYSDVTLQSVSVEIWGFYSDVTLQSVSVEIWGFYSDVTLQRMVTLHKSRPMFIYGLSDKRAADMSLAEDDGLVCFEKEQSNSYLRS